MKTILFVLAFGSALSLVAQQATVTIYTPHGAGANAKQTATLGVVPGAYPFLGSIYDGDARLGFFTSGRFITLKVNPGKHTFYASDHQHKNTPKAETVLDVQPGGQYFIRASMTHKGVAFVQAFHYELEPLSCKDARAEADTMKPIDIRKVDKEERSNLVGLAYFPACATTTP